MNFMRIPNEELLLHYLAQKDNRAFRHLYGVYFVALKSIAIRYVKDDQIACDLVQDVFISLLESTHRFISGDEVKYFLYSALKNRCVSYFRKQQVRDRDSTPNFIASENYGENSPIRRRLVTHYLSGKNRNIIRSISCLFIYLC